MLTKLHAPFETSGPAPAVHGTDRRPHAVIVGAGFGGLAAGIRLGARGYRVTVIDKLDGPGGRGTVFRQDGFTFDAGPTLVTVPHLFEDLWALCGKRMADHVELRALDPFYKIRFDDGDTFTCRGDHEAMRAEVARIAPDDLKGYERFMAGGEKRYRIGFERMGHQPFSRFSDMLRWIPELAWLRADRSVHGEVATRVRNPKLRAALSFHPLFIGGDPFTVTSMYCLVAYLESEFGVHYAMGGTNRLAQGMADLVEDRGGSLRYNAEVDEITVRDGRATGVRLASGQEIAADIVVSNADVAWTYGHLMRNHRRRRWTDAKLSRSHYSMGLYVWYFGTDRRWDEVDHHTIVLGPRYKDLVRDIFRRGHLADDMSIYLHRPSATDPSVAPPGCDSFYALAPVPHLGFGQDWAQEGERYRRLIEKRLEETVLPGLSGHVVSQTQLTPADFRTRYLSPNGAGFSFEPRLFQSAWFRPHNVSEEADGLYLVGAGTHPGAGLPGVVGSALLLDSVVPDAAELV